MSSSSRFRMSNVRSNVIARRQPFGERADPLRRDTLRTAPRARERVGFGRLHADDARLSIRDRFGRCSSRTRRCRRRSARGSRRRPEDPRRSRARRCRHPRSAAARSPSARSEARARRLRARPIRAPRRNPVPSSTTVAPNARMAAFLSGLLPTGTATMHGTPARCAANAIDWPWLPVLAVMTPRSRSSSSSDGDEVQPAANLERAGRVVILVLDVNIEAGLRGEQRMPHQRRAAYHAVRDRARGRTIGQRRRQHVPGTFYR